MSVRLGRLILFVGAILAISGQRSPGLTIENQFVSASWNEGSHQLTLSRRTSGAAFARSEIRLADHAVARLDNIANARFGAGQVITILSPDGITYRVQVYPDLPFVLIDGKLVNSGATADKKNRVAFASFETDWGVAAKDLMTFGTGGLLNAAANPGSYAWLAVVKPKSKSGVVFGWITHDRASGVLFSSVDNGKVVVDTRLDYGRLTIEPGGSASLETLAVG